MRIMRKFQWIGLLLICLLMIKFLYEMFYKKISADNKADQQIQAGLNCYTKKNINVNITYLEDMMSAKIRPKLGKNIFFHETSCLNGTVELNARQACAIESAARSNSNTDIYVIFASPVGFRSDTPKSPWITALDEYLNVHWRNVDLWSYTQNTTAELWMNDNVLFHSSYLNAHTADFLRLLSLYKFGGTHVDLDFVMKKSLSDLQYNYAGAESEDLLANGLMNFDSIGFGHDIAEKCISEFIKNFDGHLWAGNGPTLITRIVKEFCPHLKCAAYKVLPTTDLYAIHYSRWMWFFDQSRTEEVMRLTQNSTAVHFWNKLSTDVPVKVGSNVAYGLLAAEYCPKVYASCGDVF